MAPLLVGSAATGLGGAFGIGTAATTGLFGTAGSLALAPSLITGATGLAAAGAIQSGRAAEATGRSQQNLATFNAQVQEQQKAAIQTAAKFKSRRQAAEAARIKSSLRTKIAADGGAGSPVAEDLSAEQASELELENLLLGFEGAVASSQAERQGSMDIAGGRISRERGANLRTASQIKAGTTLLTGFA